MEKNMKNCYLKIDNIDSFELKDIFECGQCFRWKKIDENTYVGVIKQGVVKVEKELNTVSFSGCMLDEIEDFEAIIRDYFDLDTDYSSIKEKLSKIDSYMKESISFGTGIRILHQDLWETLISFIISANNNIPRIKGIIDRIAKKYGKKVEFEGEEYFLFPTVEELKDAKVEDFKALGTGFRDKRLYKTSQMVYSQEISLTEIESLDDTSKMRDMLLKFDGVGPKVADCILLFALKRFDVFPVDVWVRRVMNDLYIKKDDESKVSKNEILKLAADKFGSLSGMAQQYLFYWRREEK